MRHLRELVCCLWLAMAVAMQADNRVISQHGGDRVIRVQPGDSEGLLKAIAQANEQNADKDSQRLFILIPDGLYDLGERTLTTITGHNVSLVGQSMAGTVIRNAPAVENEGISKTATILNRGTGTYMQDLTLQNALDYYHSGSAGRAVCLHDKGTRTICKRVRMLSYQDTYYSDNEDANNYFEDSEIHGTVDFICGAGDVYFKNCTIETERRYPDGHGHCVIAAPRTSHTQWGYVFDGCTIRTNTSAYDYARGWHTAPRCVWLNTTLMEPQKLRDARFDTNGMRTVNSYFKEYGTRNAQGENIMPASNVITLVCNGDSNTVQTVMTRREARNYSPRRVFPGWRPDKVARRLEKKCRRLTAAGRRGQSSSGN